MTAFYLRGFNADPLSVLLPFERTRLSLPPPTCHFLVVGAEFDANAVLDRSAAVG